MRKKLSLVLVLAMILAIAIPVIASSAKTVTVEGFAFHCGTNGGNGKTYIEGKAKDFGKFDKKTNEGLVKLTATSDPKVWEAVVPEGDAWVCTDCGYDEWISFSNKSGTPDGKNIQLTHIKPADSDLSKDPVIYKTVNGQRINEAGVSLAGISFEAYQGDAKVAAGKLNADGSITFTPRLADGIYTIVEVMDSTAASLYVAPGAMELTVAGELAEFTETTKYISDESVGAVISEEAGNRRWDLPKVWNDELGSKLDTLHAMGAQWIWGVSDTYQYGVTGSVWETEFKVTVDKDMTVPIHFAADNVAWIYVNGKLQAYTDTALERRNPAAYLSDFNRNNLTFDDFNGRWAEGWAHVYTKPLTLKPGENTITIIAANSARTYGTGTDNDGYDTTNNPCGIIFGFEIESTSFNNRLINKITAPEIPEPFTPSADVSFNKTAYNGELNIDLTQFAFELYKGSELIDTVTPDWSGHVTAENLEPGEYSFKEVTAFLWNGSVGDGSGAGTVYDLVWKAEYPGGADALYFTVEADGTVVWADYYGDTPTVNNVIYCKHNRLLAYGTETYYTVHGHDIISNDKGIIINFSDEPCAACADSPVCCKGMLEIKGIRAASCNGDSIVWLECSEYGCGIGTGITIGGSALTCNLVPVDVHGSLGEGWLWYGCENGCGASKVDYDMEAWSVIWSELYGY